MWYSEEKVQQRLEFRRELAWALINNPHCMPAPQYVMKTRSQSNPLTLTSCLLARSTLDLMTGMTSFLVPLIPTISSPVRQLNTPNRQECIAYVLQPTGYVRFIGRNILVRLL